MKTGMKIYFVISTALLLLLSYRVFFGLKTGNELVLNKLSIVDRNSGKPVLILADSIPEPTIDGKVLPRIFKPRGLIYYDSKGNETGGLVVVNQGGKEIAMFAVDYNNTDAFNIYKNETDSTYRMGLIISDRNTKKEFEERGSGGIRRIVLENANKTAAIAITDTKGRERILFMVDNNDEVKLLVLDSLGNTVKNLIDK